MTMETHRGENRDALDLAVLSLNNISIRLDLVVCRLHLLLWFALVLRVPRNLWVTLWQFNIAIENTWVTRHFLRFQ